VLEHENTLFSTKNACKGWPIGFMIWPIEILRKGPWAFDMDKVHAAIIVMPVSLIINWEKEFQKW
jgi:hypothetical protein